MRTILYICFLVALITLVLVYWLLTRSKRQHAVEGFIPFPGSNKTRLLFPAYGMPYPGGSAILMYGPASGSTTTASPQATTTAAVKNQGPTTKSPAATQTATPARRGGPGAGGPSGSTVDPKLLELKTTVSTWLGKMYEFWKTKGPDGTDGSFASNHGPDGNKATVTPDALPTSTGVGEKTTVQQARHLWFFSTIAQHDPSKKTEALKIAANLFGYLKGNPPRTTPFPYSLSRTPADTRINLFTLWFAIYGISAYANVAEDTAKDTAKSDAVTLATSQFTYIHSQTFLYPNSTTPIGYLSTDGSAPEGLPVLDSNNQTATAPAKISLNSAMHGIEALTELHKVADATNKPKVETALKMLMDLVQKMIHPNKTHILDLYDPAPNAQQNHPIINYGHNIELCLLVDLACTQIGLDANARKTYLDPLVTIATKLLIDPGTAWDSTSKSIIDSNEDGKKTKREWWVQVEGMVTLEFLYNYTKDDKFRKRLVELFSFVQKYWKDLAVGGEMVTMLNTDGTVSDANIGHNWKSSFHTGRSFMMLEKLLKDVTADAPGAGPSAACIDPAPTATCDNVMITSSNPQFQSLLAVQARKLATQPSPTAFFEPTCAAHVAAIIKCANTANKPWRVRNGGHSYEQQSLVDKGWIIDLHKMTNISIDAATKTITVGAGNLLGTVYKALYENNPPLYIPGGTGPTVGISGVTLGGGIGFATRKHGPLCASVISAAVVLADGTIVSHEEMLTSNYKDLMTALRGGGPFYAVVTEWKFQAYEAPAKVTVIKYTWPDFPDESVSEATAKAKAKSLLSKFVGATPWNEIKDIAHIEFFHGFTSVTLEIHIHGNTSLPRCVEAMLDVGQQPSYNQEFTSWKDYIYDTTNLSKQQTDLERLQVNYQKEHKEFMVYLRSQTASDQKNFAASSLMFSDDTPLSDTTIGILSSSAIKKDKYFYQIRAFGNVTQDVTGRETSWPHYKVKLECQIYGEIANISIPDQVVKEVKQPPSVSVGHYFNYINSGIQSFDSYFTPTIASNLKCVKKKYDPEGKIMKDALAAPNTANITCPP